MHHVAGTLKETNELRIKTAKTPKDNIETVLSEYSDVFQGIGCFWDKSTGKKIEVKLEMDPSTEPVAHTLYRITCRSHLKIGLIKE